MEYQKLIAENLMLRLFYELEKCIEGVVLKLVRGAQYLDGNSPSLLVLPFTSQEAARQYIIRTKKVYYLEWTTLQKVSRNLNGIMDSSDHFLATRNLFDSTYEDMRHVRNHIAHNATSTKVKFATVVRQVYPTIAGISPAKFLLSKRPVIAGYGGNEMAVAQYIRWSRTFIKTLTKSTM